MVQDSDWDTKILFAKDIHIFIIRLWWNVNKAICSDFLKA